MWMESRGISPPVETSPWMFWGGKKPFVPPFTANCKTSLPAKQPQYLSLLGKGSLLSLQQIHSGTSCPQSFLATPWKKLLVPPIAVIQTMAAPGNQTAIKTELEEWLFMISPPWEHQFQSRLD